jgi:regulator of cell morphogenesis and NO signaling
MNITEKNVIGQLVAEDYRTAEVFSKHNIDFCCKGDQTIGAVCEKKKINSTKLLAELNEVKMHVGDSAIDYKSWPLDLLADYIEKKHHRYVEEKIPVIKKYLTKVSSVHGPAHPELTDIHELFFATADALTVHMKKEELVLFPYIRRIVINKEQAQTPAFGSVENPISIMKEDHNVEGERFRRIAELSDNYTPPVEACNTYRVTYALLKEFEADLHLHIHLENNILFPGAIQREAELAVHNSCEI